MNARAIELFDELLRAPKRSAERSVTGDDLPDFVLSALAAVVVGAGTFGAVLATSRGGIQLVYSALKLPLALLATLVLVVPAFHAISSALERPLAFRGVVALSLAATARAALLLVAFAPVMWLALDLGVGYHDGVLLAVACYAVAGLAALRLLLHGVGFGARGAVIVAVAALVVCPVGGQTAWLFRPFFGRPAQVEVPLYRHKESSFLDAVYKSARSSVGIYDAIETSYSREAACEPPFDCARPDGEQRGGKARRR